jgi:hypothetical protein
MGTQYEVSEVKPLSSYVAKHCPMRVQLDVLRPVPRRPESAAADLRKREGIAFESEIVQRLREVAGAGWVFLDETSGDAAERTARAMEDGAPVVVNGALPTDGEGKRSGRPDLLVQHEGGYVPVDVKHHLTLEGEVGEAHPTSPLGAPTPLAAVARPGFALRRHKGDALQLAHYRRMLESTGHASGSLQAGIIGTEGEVTWYDLGEEMWRTPSKSEGWKKRSAMDVYDFEFDFRLDITAVAMKHRDDPATPTLVLPVRCGDCDECAWREYCFERMEQGHGDPSLLPRIGYRPWRALRDRRIEDRAGVAELNLLTARLGKDKVDLVEVLKRAGKADSPEDPVSKLLGRKKKQIALLEAEGIRTAGDVLARIDPDTAAFEGAGFLPDAIVQARAILGPEPVYRLPGADGEGVPRADLELDVDMENTDDGVYLWGVHIHDRGSTGLVEAEGYREFVEWNPIDASRERDLFQRFWAWLAALLDSAERQDATVAVYVWNEGAEKGQMRRIAAHTGLADQVEALVSSKRWHDLEKTFKSQWVTGGPTRLKKIAPLAGHEWRVDDPGGAHSMVKHHEATAQSIEEQTRDEARNWLLEYNCGDVEATFVIRGWLDERGGTWPALPADGTRFRAQ